MIKLEKLNLNSDKIALLVYYCAAFAVKFNTCKELSSLETVTICAIFPQSHYLRSRRSSSSKIQKFKWYPHSLLG